MDAVCHDRYVTQALLVLAVALTIGAVVFGIAVLLSSDRHGLRPAEPDARAVPLPADRPLVEPDLPRVRFDTALRGYRMAQVDAAMQRAAYDIGYKDELIKVLQAEIVALREGRFPDAEVLRRAREAAAVPAVPPASRPGDGTPAAAGGDAGGDAGGAGDTGGAGGAGEPERASAAASASAAGEREAGATGVAGVAGVADESGEAMPGDAAASGRR